MIEYLLLTPREFAVVILILITLTWSLINSKIRKSLGNLIKSFFALKFFNTFLIIVIYTELLSILLHSLGIWTLYSLKETIIWLIIEPVQLLVNSVNSKFSFRKIVSQQLSIVPLVTFLVDQYTFALPYELILIFMIVFVSLLYASSSYQDQFKILRKPLSIILSILGSIIVLNSIYHLILHSVDNSMIIDFRDYLIFPVYTIFSLPLVYLILVYSSYEVLFMRCSFMLKNNPILLKKIRHIIIWKCRLNIKKIRQTSDIINFSTLGSIDALKEAMKFI